VDSAATVIAGLVDADPKIADAVVRGLGKGWPAGKTAKLDEGVEQDLERLVNRLPAERRGVLIKLASVWGSKKFEENPAEASRALLAQVTNESLKPEERLAAARELIGHKATDKETVQTILELITPGTPPEVSAGFLEALRGSEAPEAGRLILQHLPGLTP